MNAGGGDDRGQAVGEIASTSEKMGMYRRIVYSVVLFIVVIAAFITLGFINRWTGAWSPANVVFVIAVLLAVASLMIARALLPKPQGRSEAVSPPVPLTRHVDARFAERVAEANERLTEAKTKLETSRSALDQAKSAADADKPNEEKQKKAREAKQEFEQAAGTVAFEESMLDHLLHTDPWQRLLDRMDGMAVLQYVIFGSLALYVLTNLMNGIASSPPPGTTPRSMITLLISVVTVGIALILVLSTIVAESVDERRFSQGKEVLTALLGVLGTIVGFYFGTSQDQAGVFTFDPVVVTRDADRSVTLTTAVHGGKPPYALMATFTPPDILPVTRQIDADGHIVMKPDTTSVKQDEDFSVLIEVTDGAGKAGTYKQAVHIKAKTSP